MHPFLQELAGPARVGLFALVGLVSNLDAGGAPQGGIRSPRTERCCAFNMSLKRPRGTIVLERICPTADAVTVHLRAVAYQTSMCTDPPATFLIDQRKQRYPMTSHSGLAECTKGRTEDPNASFSWTFAPLRGNPGAVDVEEFDNPKAPGLSNWAWRNLDLKSCLPER
jgi:hypothetical protein